MVTTTPEGVSGDSVEEQRRKAGDVEVLIIHSLTAMEPIVGKVFIQISGLYSLGKISGC